MTDSIKNNEKKYNCFGECEDCELIEECREVDREELYAIFAAVKNEEKKEKED